jgi:NTE family protein
MPFGSEGVEAGISLALSGGGFRATLFHIGSGRRLLELGVLPCVVRISSVSGGSIFSGTLGSCWEELTRDFSVANYEHLVVEPLRQFCRLPIDAVAIADGEDVQRSPSAPPQAVLQVRVAEAVKSSRAA